jgi:hypothetical protein
MMAVVQTADTLLVILLEFFAGKVITIPYLEDCH